MSSSPLAIIPARVGSKGVPFKNTMLLGGISPVARAVHVAKVAGLHTVVTSDANVREQLEWGCNADAYHKRPAELATDDAPMIGVVQDVLASMPGFDPILLIQPTQPLREPKHLLAALELLTPEVDSVVSVIETRSPGELLSIIGEGLMRACADERYAAVAECPSRRQDMRPGYWRDGTCYAFHRQTVERYGNLYGVVCKPLIIPAEESCPLDTPADWREAERRLQERQR